MVITVFIRIIFNIFYQDVIIRSIICSIRLNKYFKELNTVLFLTPI